MNAAQALFKIRNTEKNAAFRVIRRQLRRMSASPQRCGWCEDSEAGEIDHIRPKGLFPEHTFVWDNFLGACGVCNNRKGSRFAILGPNGLVDITRQRDEPVIKPPSGPSALIDPRVEDPLILLELEARNTFHLQPRYGLSQRGRDRATYTAGLLFLNREALVLARRRVFADNREVLSSYRDLRESGGDAARLERLKDVLLQRPHPTVWREMQRQHELSSLVGLFRDVPEALSW
ncbi:MAG: hypothetical protein J4F45_10250 [Pseudomonadales bacterium]|nr:hypothetical protein [Pseudomonadales bacterium]